MALEKDLGFVPTAPRGPPTALCKFGFAVLGGTPANSLLEKLVRGRVGNDWLEGTTFYKTGPCPNRGSLEQALQPRRKAGGRAAQGKEGDSHLVTGGFFPGSRGAGTGPDCEAVILSRAISFFLSHCHLPTGLEDCDHL